MQVKMLFCPAACGESFLHSLIELIVNIGVFVIGIVFKWMLLKGCYGYIQQLAIHFMQI